jgi:putative heme-binding domain-containing protein
LTQFPAPAIQDRAKKLFEAQTSDREKVVADFQDVLKLTANPASGKQVFEDHCAKCHLSRGERGRIGPDLSGVNNKTTAELLTHILDPSFEIQPNYTNYLVVDNFGRMYDGLLVGETEHTVKLRGELEDVSIPRKSITEMRASSVSLMPDGLEAEMSRQDLADVIAYLRAGL